MALDMHLQKPSLDLEVLGLKDSSVAFAVCVQQFSRPWCTADFDKIRTSAAANSCISRRGARTASYSSTFVFAM